MFKAKCPLCNGTYQAKPEWIGKQAPCPHCHKRIVIQVDEKEPVPLVMPVSSGNIDSSKPTETDTSVPINHSVSAQTSNTASGDNLHSETQPNTLFTNDTPITAETTGKHSPYIPIIKQLLSFIIAICRPIVILLLIFAIFIILILVLEENTDLLKQNEFANNITTIIYKYLYIIRNDYWHYILYIKTILLFILFLFSLLKGLFDNEYRFRITSSFSLSETLKVGAISTGFNILGIIFIIINHRNPTISKLSNIEINLLYISCSFFSITFIMALFLPIFLRIISNLLVKEIKIFPNSLPFGYHYFIILESVCFNFFDIIINGILLNFIIRVVS